MFSEDSSSPGGAQPRNSTRVPLETQVNLEFEKFSGFISEYSSNISQGGIFIRTQEPKKVGTILSFEFKLRDNFKLIQGLGEVAWIRTEDQGPSRPAGMGIRFHELDERSRELITTMVDNYIKGGGQPFDLDEPTTTPNDSPSSAPIPPKNNPVEESTPPPPVTDSVEEDFQALFAQDNEVPESNTEPIPSVTETPPIVPEQPPSMEKTEVSEMFVEMPDPEPSPEPHDESPLEEVESPEAFSLANHLEGDSPILEDEVTPTRNKKKPLVLGGIALLVCGLAYLIAGPLLGLFGSDSPERVPQVAQKASKTPPKNQATKTKAPSSEPKEIVPTVVPTAVPTTAPTTVPTTAPTVSPTVAPTATPIPTPVPSPVPTVKPQKATPALPVARPRIIGSGTLSKIDHITWEKKGNRTFLSIWGNAPIREEAYRRIRLSGKNPREVIKILGVQAPFSKGNLTVGNSELSRIRTGHHSGNELHIVLDLAGSNIQVLRTSKTKNKITLTLGAK